MINDEEILGKFTSQGQFANWWNNWSSNDKQCFFRLARTLNAAGLDWYHVNINRQIRCGQKMKGAVYAKEIFLVISNNKPKAWIQSEKDREALSLPHDSDVSLEDLVNALEAAPLALQRFQNGTAYWPDELTIDADASIGSEAPQDSRAELFGDQADASVRRFWIEKTIVNGRDDRLSGAHALGQALWSPQRSKDGKNIYASMLEVKPGDVVFHLVDNREIAGVSLVKSGAEQSFVGLAGSPWAGEPSYRIALVDYLQLKPPLPRAAFLRTEPFATELRKLAESGQRGLFYNSRCGLNQGAYLTEVTPTLRSILNRAYVEQAGHNLPYIDEQQVVLELGGDKAATYTLDDALQELFLSREEAEDILLLWRAKRNIILQGPPGVGKSFAAHKLAYALMAIKDQDKVGFVQFHQSYSYEDFVEGFRPAGQGFELKPGKFVDFCRKAEADPTHKYVFIIDEINRGNLSKILGELMLLIEPDKRDPKWAMPLASGKVPFHVPSNVYIMGLMNTADRSLAVVDYALRRRFAFVSLMPKLTSPRFNEHLAALGISDDVRDVLYARVGKLNEEIIGDTINLGPGFAIGHSFFCAGPSEGENDKDWYRRVVRTELLPLLQEYWFDTPDKAEGWKARLLANA